MSWLFVLGFALAVLSLITMTVLLVTTLRAQARTERALMVQLERTVDALAARDANEFLRMQRASSTSLMYSPSEPAPEDDPPDDAYQRAIKLGVPDDVAQYLEE